MQGHIYEWSTPVFILECKTGEGCYIKLFLAGKIYLKHGHEVPINREDEKKQLNDFLAYIWNFMVKLKVPRDATDILFPSYGSCTKIDGEIIVKKVDLETASNNLLQSGEILKAEMSEGEPVNSVDDNGQFLLF